MTGAQRVAAGTDAGMSESEGVADVRAGVAMEVPLLQLTLPPLLPLLLLELLSQHSLTCTLLLLQLLTAQLLVL